MYDDSTGCGQGTYLVTLDGKGKKGYRCVCVQYSVEVYSIHPLFSSTLLLRMPDVAVCTSTLRDCLGDCQVTDDTRAIDRVESRDARITVRISEAEAQRGGVPSLR